MPLAGRPVSPVPGPRGCGGHLTRTDLAQARLVAALRELGSLVRQAEDLFSSLEVELVGVAGRTASLAGRTNTLQSAVQAADSNTEPVGRSEIACFLIFFLFLNTPRESGQLSGPNCALPQPGGGGDQPCDPRHQAGLHSPHALQGGVQGDGAGPRQPASLPLHPPPHRAQHRGVLQPSVGDRAGTASHTARSREPCPLYRSCTSTV